MHSSDPAPRSGRTTGLFGTTVFFIVVLALFFLSGACGLVYQVVWTRKLVLVMGAAAYAVSTVLSVFFLGLAGGSLWGGRLADRSRNPLFLYGAFQIVIGLWALAFLLVIDHAEVFTAVVLGALQFSRAAGIAARALLSFALLIVPVFLMGATLPLLSRCVTTSLDQRGRRIGALYSLNTFGAVAGCTVAGFLLVPQMGYLGATVVAVATNVAVGFGAILLSRVAPSPEMVVQTDAEGVQPAPDRLVYAVAGMLGISGFCALALEVMWTRLLGIVFLGTTYAFTTMLAALLCGLAVGGGVAALWGDRWKRHVCALGVIEALFGIACLVMLTLFEQLPAMLDQYRIETGYNWAALVRAKFYLSFMVLFVPMFLSGMTFPTAVRAVAARADRLGRHVGLLYGANTFGGVLGALAGGFLIIPVFGTQAGIITLGLTLTAAGIMLIGIGPQATAARKAQTAVGLMLAAAIAYATIPTDVSRTLNQWFVPDNHETIHYSEGVEGTVLVTQPVDKPSGSDRVLWINAVQATASIEKGVKMNRFQGVLPMFFDREIDEILFMCFGSGITAGMLGLWDVDGIDAVEIAPEVIKAAALFNKDNFDVLENPKLNVIVDDGRNFLLTTDKRYDLITFEPMPLALAGVSSFYTREYYELCFDRLAPGGLVSQWVPLHSLRPDIVKSLLRTFTDVFPHYTLWFINADLFIIGSDQPLTIDYARLEERFADSAIMSGLREVALTDIPELLTAFFMDGESIERYVGEGTIMTDNRPWAEFIAPRLVYERHVDKALAELEPFYMSPLGLIDFSGLSADRREAASEAIARRWRSHANDLTALQHYYGGMVSERPAELFRASLEIDPLNANARYYLAQILQGMAERRIRWTELDKAEESLDEALEYAPRRPELHLLLGDVYRETGRVDQAAAAYRRHLELGGGSLRAKAFLEGR